MDIAFRLFIFFVPFLFALCVHEYAHGLVAKWKGDNTAEMMGRLNLNPLSHMDPIGTFMLPVLTIVGGAPVSFGWAKPVPVNERNLRNPRSDMFWIALAGPLSNLLMAIATLVLLKFFGHMLLMSNYAGPILQLAGIFIVLNIMLCIFNMIPIHPLDGGKVLARFLPESINRKLEDNMMYSGIILLVLILMFAPVLGRTAHMVTMLLAQLIGVRI